MLVHLILPLKTVINDESSNVDDGAHNCEIVNLYDDEENTETISADPLVNLHTYYTDVRKSKKNISCRRRIRF